MCVMHDPDAPALMVAETGALCAQSRKDHDFFYGKLLRANILDALHCTFPRSCALIGETCVAALVDDFLLTHTCLRPQFHHIATEFLSFSQLASNISPKIMTLIEYEWALLDTEIHPANIISRHINSLDDNENRALVLNPTAKFLLLGFDPFSDSDMALENISSSKMPYAIYRTHTHGIMTRMLSRQDCLAIEALRKSQTFRIKDLRNPELPNYDDCFTHQWFVEAVASDLLVLA